MTNIGDERFMAEMIDVTKVEAMAREQGWPGGIEGLREFCEPADAADYSVHQTLEDATRAAKEWLAKGKDFFGAVMIDRQVFEREYRNVPPGWVRQQTWEVTLEGEPLETAA